MKSFIEPIYIPFLIISLFEIISKLLWKKGISEQVLKGKGSQHLT